MLSREIFEILRAVMVILVLFEHFSGKFCLNFWTLILSTDAFWEYNKYGTKIAQGEKIKPL